MTIFRIQSSYEPLQTPTTHKIHYISQFFLHPNPTRKQEIISCLKRCADHPSFTTIHLLNERIYTQDELNLSNPQFKKVKQTNIKERLTYKHVFDYVEQQKLSGYIVLANNDIFFDHTLNNIFRTSLSKKKSIYAQLRMNYHPKYGSDLSKCILFQRGKTPRADSQDTWIFHSTFNVPQKYRHLFSFQLGTPGCDNHLLFLLQKQLQFTIFNLPYRIKTYHFHSSNIRSYTDKNRLNSHYLFVAPCLKP